jgi:crotonobetainyl-CoA:carnitine CoA-transferase CaiB-like acyl-CoA transferase
MPLPSLPFRTSSAKHWLRTHAPTLGQHNERVLRDVLGLSEGAIRSLEAEGVIGNRPARL